MKLLSLLFAGYHVRAPRIALRPQDCPSCWKARAHSLRWSSSTCSGCGKVHRAWKSRLMGT